MQSKLSVCLFFVFCFRKKIAYLSQKYKAMSKSYLFSLQISLVFNFLGKFRKSVIDVRKGSCTSSQLLTKLSSRCSFCPLRPPCIWPLPNISKFQQVSGFSIKLKASCVQGSKQMTEYSVSCIPKHFWTINKCNGVWN